MGGTERFRQQRTEVEQVLKDRSVQAHKGRLAAAEEQQQQINSAVAAARAKLGEGSPGLAKIASNPNVDFAVSQRHGKTMILCGDGRSKVLSRVFLNGRWTYAT